MADPVLRLGIFLIVGSWLLVSKSPAQFPEPSTVTAQIPDQRTVTGRIVLTREQGQLVAADRLELGEVRASEWLKVEFDVVNGTDDELVFDKIVSQVDRATPEKGRIQPGESMKVSIRFQTQSGPNSEGGTQFLEFHCNDGRTGFVSYNYSFATHVGIANDFVAVPLQDSAPITEARFDVPIVIGGKLKEGDFEISLEGIAGRLDARIDPDAKLLRCLIKFDKPVEADRLQGQLVVLDLASGFLRYTPLILERQKRLEILPSFVEFIPNATDNSYVAMLYVRRVSAEPESTFNGLVETTISGIPIPCRVSAIEHDMVRCRLTIGSEQLEKLVAASTRSDSESQSATPSKLEVRITAEQIKMATSIPVSIRGQPAFEAGPSDRLFVIDAIRTGMLAMDSLSPFDIYGETTVEQEFANEPRKITEQTRFRLSLDRQSEVVVYAAETKPDSWAVLRGTDPTGTESVRYARFIIVGTSLYNSESPQSRPEVHDSFRQALSESAIPHPAHWGVTQFPGHSKIPKEIERLAIEAAGKNAKLTLSAVENGMRVTLLMEEDQGPMGGVWSWDYRLPSFEPTEMKRRRIADGSTRSILEQTIQWESVRGHEVPVLIHSEFVALRRLDGGEMKFQIGNGFRDTQLSWLSFEAKSSPANKGEVSIHNAEEIKNFIDEGEQLSDSDAQR